MTLGVFLTRRGAGCLGLPKRGLELTRIGDDKRGNSGENGPMRDIVLGVLCMYLVGIRMQQDNPLHEVYISMPSGVKSSGNVVAEVG